MGRRKKVIETETTETGVIEKPETKENKYNFITESPSAYIDFTRIIKENFKEANNNIILVNPSIGKSAVIICRQSWLNEFTKEDQISLAGAFVSPNWGRFTVYIFQNPIWNENKISPADREFVVGFEIHNDTTTIERTIKEIKRAIRYRRHNRITVMGW